MNQTSINTRHERLALFAAFAALIIGWIGSALFYGWFRTSDVLGLGFPLFIAALLVGGLSVARLMQVRLRGRVVWLIVPLLFFAGMVAVRAESTLTALNILMTLSLGGLLLHYLPLDKAPDEDSTLAHIGAVIFVGVYALVGALAELPWVRKGLSRLSKDGDERTTAVLRGIALAVPVLLVFGVLLASADTVFSEALIGLFGNMTNLGDVIRRIVLMLVLAWGVLGLISYGARVPFSQAAAPVPQTDAAQDDDAELALARAISDKAATDEKAKRLPGLGMIETSIVLGSVIALFAVFVLIQFTYLFGGQANIREGVTYAQYARRGFFELVAVAVMVIGLGRYLHWQTRRYSRRATLLFRLETVALVGLTLVLLASAWHRMTLYEAAYGFTYLRLSIYVFMLALAALFGVFLLEVFTRRRTIFAFGVLLAAIGGGVVLNAIGGEGFIAERNIARYAQGEDLDICYLKTFSVDALPQMLTLLEIAKERDDAEVIDQTRSWLRQHQDDIQDLAESPDAFAMLNVSRTLAQVQFLSVPRDERAAWAETPYASCYNRGWYD